MIVIDHASFKYTRQIYPQNKRSSAYSRCPMPTPTRNQQVHHVNQKLVHLFSFFYCCHHLAIVCIYYKNFVIYLTITDDGSRCCRNICERTKFKAFLKSSFFKTINILIFSRFCTAFFWSVFFFCSVKSLNPIRQPVDTLLTRNFQRNLATVNDVQASLHVR